MSIKECSLNTFFQREKATNIRKSYNNKEHKVAVFLLLRSTCIFEVQQVEGKNLFGTSFMTARPVKLGGLFSKLKNETKFIF